MGIDICCPHCGRYFGAPDLESVKTYAANGGMIQTLVERITAQPIHHHYITPAPLWRAVAFALPPAFLAPASVLYWHIDPTVAGGFAVVCFAVGLVIGSTQVEQTEVTNKSPFDDEPEVGQAEPQPVRVEEVTRPGKNSVSIRWAHEPPASTDPTRQLTLGKADLALAKLATATAYPMQPISWAEAKRRRYSHGEKTFYEIQRHWIKEGLAFRDTSGAVYLNVAGKRTLAKYASQ